MTGRFFLGSMNGGAIRIRRLPVMPGGSATARRFGQGEITCTIRPDMAIASTGVTLRPAEYWESITHSHDFLGYVEEHGTNQAIINIGPISYIQLSHQGLQIRAGGISTYLDNRFHEDSTVDLSAPGGGPPGSNTSLNETIFNPAAMGYTAWLQRTVNDLNARSTFAVANDLKVPIIWSPSGTQGADDPPLPPGTLQLPYAGSEFRTFYNRLNDISEAFGATWAARPTIAGANSNVVHEMSFGSADAVEWMIHAQNYYYSNIPEALDVYWKQGASNGLRDVRFTHSNDNYYSMLHGSSATTGTNIRYWGRVGPSPEGEVPPFGATDGIIVEKRWDGRGDEPKGGATEGFKFAGGARNFEFSLPRAGAIRPGHDLPGKLMRLNFRDHPTFGTKTIGIRIESITVNDSSQWFDVEGTEEEL